MPFTWKDTNYAAWMMNFLLLNYFNLQHNDINICILDMGCIFIEEVNFRYKLYIRNGEHMSELNIQV
jgi:hypothetical protein